jgi:MarR family 2-MHQ and catechol resistance regulon transcriptional repressor
LQSSRRKVDKIQRAWGAYLEMTEAASWLEEKLSVPLGVFGLTRAEFRLLVVLYRHGPLTMHEAMEKLRRLRRTLHETVRNAEEFGWVKSTERELPPAEIKETRLRKSERGKPRRGRRVRVVSLSAEGERLIGKVLPSQEAIVKSVMEALEARELDTLTRICRKLRRDDVLPYWFEVMRQDRELEASGEDEDE